LLYSFCGRYLLVAKLRIAAIDAVEEVARMIARICARWPRTRILLRADSDFAREDLMAWCEANGLDFLFGLAGNVRLVAGIASELDGVADKTVLGVSSIGDGSCEVSTSRLWRPDNYMAATVSQYGSGRSDYENDYPRVHSY
jgi:hypothetical protein